MPRHRLALLVPTLALVALALGTRPQRAFAEDEPGSPFENTAMLKEYLGGACDMVEAIKGYKFPTRPSIRVSSPEDVAKILAKEFEIMPEAMIPAANRKAFAASLAGMLMAKYEPGTHTVHIVPAGVALVDKTRGTKPKMGVEHLRVLLAHEVTHAMDFPRYGFQELRAKLKDLDAHQALNAIVEGHAQFVAEEAAKRWKLEPAFARMTAAIVGDDDGEGTDTEKAMRAAALSQIRFAYAQGHAFFTAVAKAQGNAGVERALRTPPRSSRVIEKPGLWIKPETNAAQPDLAPIAKSFAWLAPGKGWVRNDQRVLESALRSQGGRLPVERRKEWMQGLRNAYLYQAQNPTTGARFVVVVALFDTPENAVLFTALDRLIVDRAKPAVGMKLDTKALTDGAGAGNKLPGFWMHRLVSYMGQDIDIRQHVAAHGCYGVEMMLVNLGERTREQTDQAIARAIAWMDDPAAAAKLAPLALPEPPKETGETAPEKKAPEAKDAEKKKPVPAGAGG